MTPSQQAKTAGLDSLAEMARLSGVQKRTLINWHKHKPQQFRVMLAGCVRDKRIDELTNALKALAFQHKKHFGLDGAWDAELITAERVLKQESKDEA